jgi:hypothetical protein
LSIFIGDSTYTRAPPNYRSPLRSNNEMVVTARGAQAFLRVLIFVYIVTFAKGQMRCNHHWIMKG